MPSSPVTVKQVATLVDAMSLTATVASISQMQGGESDGAHLVTFVDNSTPLVVKVYEAGRGWTLGKEVFAYRLMRRNGITLIPNLLGGASAKDSPIGRPYLVMSKLPGISAEEFTPVASDEAIASTYRQMGALLRQIHGIEQEGFGYRLATMEHADRTNEVFVSRVLDERSLVYAELTGDRATVRAAKAYIADRAELFALCTMPVLLHGDFHEGNIIVDVGPGGPVVSGVIDLDSAMAGDPVADLATLYNFSIHGNELKLDALFEGYGLVPDAWDARRRLFQLVHDFELWVWYHEDGHYEYLPDVAADIKAILASG